MVNRDHQRRWLLNGRSVGPEMSVLNDHKGLDEERVSRWLGRNDAVGWKVKEGLDKRWESLEGMIEINHKGPENNDLSEDHELAAFKPLEMYQFEEGRWEFEGAVVR